MNGLSSSLSHSFKYVRWAFAGVVAAATFAVMPALAAAYPDKPVKLILGFPPGSGPDFVARTLAQALSDQMKQSVVVENRPGAGAQIAAQTVAKSPADGYTLLFADVGSIAIAPAAFKKLSYNPTKELRAIGEVTTNPFVLVTSGSNKILTVENFVKVSRAAKDPVTMGTFGPGTPVHLGAEMLGDMGGFKILPVHYRTTGDAVAAIISGDAQGALLTPSLAAPLIKAGKMRALAVTSSVRTPLLPDVPTFGERNMGAMELNAWLSLFAPAETPQDVVAFLSRSLIAVASSAAFREQLIPIGFSITGSSFGDAASYIAADTRRWAVIVEKSGFKGD